LSVPGLLLSCSPSAFATTPFPTPNPIPSLSRICPLAFRIERIFCCRRYSSDSPEDATSLPVEGGEEEEEKEEEEEEEEEEEDGLEAAKADVGIEGTAGLGIDAAVDADVALDADAALDEDAALDADAAVVAPAAAASPPPPLGSPLVRLPPPLVLLPFRCQANAPASVNGVFISSYPNSTLVVVGEKEPAAAATPPPPTSSTPPPIFTSSSPPALPEPSRRTESLTP